MKATTLIILVTTLLTGCPGPDGATDGGVSDGGPLADDGCPEGTPKPSVNLGPCNPADGTLCDVNNGRFCVWNVDDDIGACRCLGAAITRGETCDPIEQQCGEGLACVHIATDPGPVCHQVCTLSDPVECDGLSTTGSAFACLSINRGPDFGGVTTSFGLCAEVGTACDPLNDTCAGDEVCALVSATMSSCQPAGTTPIGGDCTAIECVKGGSCINLIDANGMELGPICYEPCDPGAPVCAGQTQCTNIGLAFGLCI